MLFFSWNHWEFIMSQNPAISVIMPVYNTKESYLKKAIDSVFEQSFNDYEFIIINDGSTTDIEEIILSYDDKRIKYMVQAQGGQSKARNNGLRRAIGKYIFYLDADDWIEPDTLEKVFKKSEQLNLDILLYGTYAHYSDKPSVEEWVSELGIFNDNETVLNCNHDAIQNCLFFMNQACWGKLFKREFLIKNNLFFIEGLIFEDLDILFRYMLKANRVGALKETLYHYNLNVLNSTTATGNEKYFDLFKIFELVEQTLVESNLFDKLKFKFYDLKILLYNYRYDRINPELKEKFREQIIVDLNKSKLSIKEISKLTYKNNVYNLFLEAINRSK